MADVETLQNLVRNAKDKNCDEFDLIFSKIDSSVPSNIDLESIIENDQYHKLPKLLIDSIDQYEKFQRIPNLPYFKILKRFYNLNPKDKLSEKSAEFILDILERLENNFDSQAIFSNCVLAGFEFPCETIEFHLFKILPNFKFYSAPTDQIIRILQYVKCLSNSNTSRRRLLELEDLLRDCRRILNLLSSEKRTEVENLLDSFSTG